MQACSVKTNGVYRKWMVQRLFFANHHHQRSVANIAMLTDYEGRIDGRKIIQ